MTTKTLRVRTRSGWVTKPEPNTPENRLMAQEVDDNFLAIEDAVEAIEGAVATVGGRINDLEQDVSDLETEVAGKVSKDGDTMTGALEMPDLRLITAGNLSSDSIEINFSQGHAYMTRWVGGNVAFTSTGFLNGVTRTIRLANAGASRTLTFPSAWRFVGPKPTAIGAGNHAVLTVTCFAGTEDSVIAAYAEEIA